MTRHPVDWLSLIVGALGVLVAVSLLTDLRLGAIVGDVGPLAAVIIGLAVLGAALRGTRSPQTAAERPAAGDAARDTTPRAPTAQDTTAQNTTARDTTRELDAPSDDGDDAST